MKSASFPDSLVKFWNVRNALNVILKKKNRVFESFGLNSGKIECHLIWNINQKLIIKWTRFYVWFRWFWTFDCQLTFCIHIVVLPYLQKANHWDDGLFCCLLRNGFCLFICSAIKSFYSNFDWMNFINRE